MVLEIDPQLKQELYAVLESQRLTMKEWFVREAEHLIFSEKQPSLFGPEAPTSNQGRSDEF